MPTRVLVTDFVIEKTSRGSSRGSFQLHSPTSLPLRRTAKQVESSRRASAAPRWTAFLRRPSREGVATGHPSTARAPGAGRPEVASTDPATAPAVLAEVLPAASDR